MNVCENAKINTRHTVFIFAIITFFVQLKFHVLLLRLLYSYTLTFKWHSNHLRSM